MNVANSAVMGLVTGLLWAFMFGQLLSVEEVAAAQTEFSIRCALDCINGGASDLAACKVRKNF